MEPGIALGGFEKPEENQSIDYRMSKGVILTFVINNYKDKDAIAPAMEWEEK